MRQTTLMIATAVLGLAAVAPTQAQNGLQAPTAATSWPQWQGRFALGLSPQTLNDSPRLRGSSLLGDYYFYRHPMTSPTSPLGGFRATSGLMLGGSSTPRLLTGLGADLTSGRAVGLSGGLLSLQPLGWSNENDDNTASYLGLGYTLMSLRGGWASVQTLVWPPQPVQTQRSDLVWPGQKQFGRQPARFAPHTSAAVGSQLFLLNATRFEDAPPQVSRKT